MKKTQDRHALNVKKCLVSRVLSRHVIFYIYGEIVVDMYVNGQEKNVRYTAEG